MERKIASKIKHSPPWKKSFVVVLVVLVRPCASFSSSLITISSLDSLAQPRAQVFHLQTLGQDSPRFSP